MAFNCSVVLSDIDINCNLANVGGIKKVVLGLQSNLSLQFDPSDETKLTDVQLTDGVVFEHSPRDGSTTFSESKTISNGLGVISTNISIQLPRVDNKVNMIDYMSRREDIVCLMLHNNGSITISGWMDGLSMDYSATSGTALGEKSAVDVTLKTESWIASMVLDNDSVVDPAIFA